MLDKVSIIIPVHNILKRGLKRVRNSVISLLEQKQYIEDIIIVNSSGDSEFKMLSTLLKGLDCKHVHIPSISFNKPKLLNIGIKKSNSKYIMCTDADYLFKSDFLKTCIKYREGRMLHKQVKMIPFRMNITDNLVRRWRFPKSNFNEWGTLANGACQYATKDFFTDNPYPEQMDGFSAMDNIMAYIAYNNGLEVHWVIESEILHQWHPIEKKMTGDNKIKFQRNQKVLSDYIKKYNLPKLLKR